MTEFDYELTPGIDIDWGITVSGYEDETIDGSDLEPCRSLVEVESTIEDFSTEYRERMRAVPVRIRGAHGWREIEWNDGSLHRWEWRHYPIDLRCPECLSPDNNLYMVHDDLWQSAGLNGYVCFRCFEKNIGRRLTPADFKPALPANDARCHHGPELRQRIGY